MPGQFLELALSTDEVLADCAGYEQLGFVAAQTGDVWPHHYGVMACHGLCIALHGLPAAPPTLVFTRENVAALARELDARGLQPTQMRLGSDVFNELSLHDPAGNRVRVLEARTFTPPAAPALTRLGRFEALSLPCDDVALSRDYWQQLGFVADSDTAGDLSVLRGGGLVLMLHPRAQAGAPLLRFGPVREGQTLTRYTLPAQLLALSGSADINLDQGFSSWH